MKDNEKIIIKNSDEIIIKNFDEICSLSSENRLKLARIKREKLEKDIFNFESLLGYDFPNREPLLIIYGAMHDKLLKAKSEEQSLLNEIGNDK